MTSVEASLKKLRTSYIDILYLHWVSGRCYCGDDRLSLYIACNPFGWLTFAALPARSHVLHIFITAAATKVEAITTDACLRCMPRKCS